MKNTSPRPLIAGSQGVGRVPAEMNELSLGTYLRTVRQRRRLSLRDVQRLARQNEFGATLSSGYLSVLERDGVKDPSPKMLFTLAAIYEVDYIDVMQRAGYIPPDTSLSVRPQTHSALIGVSRLDDEQLSRIQHMIYLELNEARRRRKPDARHGGRPER